MERQMVCAVSVATVWTAPDSPREVDSPAIRNPASPDRWLSGLSFGERLALCDEDRIQTQLLYGEPVIVTETADDWAKIHAVLQSSGKDAKGYPGWVPLAQLSDEAGGSGASVRVTAKKAWLTEATADRFLEISFNTTLPFDRIEDGWFSVRTPHGLKLLRKEDAELTGRTVGSFDPVTAGRQFIGLPYLWGGMSAWGFDCSGFIHNIWKAAGVGVPRDASDQAGIGEPVSLELASWRAGDLLFFAKSGKPVSHVGMYAGGGEMLHAPSTGKSVEQIPLADSSYMEILRAVRRIQP